MMIVGNYLVERCGLCGKYVRLNKWMFGSLHLCVDTPPRLHPLAQAQIDMRRDWNLANMLLGVQPPPAESKAPRDD